MYLCFSLPSSFGHIAKDYKVHKKSDEEGGGTGDTGTETDETIETDETKRD